MPANLLPTFDLAFWLAALGSLLLGFVGNWIWDRYSTLLPSMKNSEAHAISGVWVAMVAGQNKPGVFALEVLRIRESKGHVTLYIEQYHSQAKAPIQYAGKGVWRGGNLSAYYSNQNKKSTTSGVLTAHALDTVSGASQFWGKYTQVINRANEPAQVLSEPYACVACELPLRQQVRRLVGKTYFKGVDEAQAFYQALPEADRAHLLRAQSQGDPITRAAPLADTAAATVTTETTTATNASHDGATPAQPHGR